MSTLKDYLEKLAAQPAIAPRREATRRRSCERCDGELFLLPAQGDALCAGCGASLRIDQASRSS